MPLQATPSVRYECTTYDGQQIATRTATREQIAGIDYRRYDYVMSKVLGIWGYLTADGEWIEHTNGDWPGIGTVCVRVIQTQQLNPGEFLLPSEISYITGYASLQDCNALSARLRAIREAHGESFKKPNFFLSKRTDGFGIAWNAQKSWMWLEKIPILPAERGTAQESQIAEEVEL